MPKLNDAVVLKIRAFEAALRDLVDSPEIDTREKAMLLKEAVGRPIGILNKKHGFASSMGKKGRIIRVGD